MNLSEAVKIIERQSRTIKSQQKEIDSLRHQNEELKAKERVGRWGKSAGLQEAAEEMAHVEKQMAQWMELLLAFLTKTGAVEVISIPNYERAAQFYGENITRAGITIFARQGDRFKISYRVGDFAGELDDLMNEALPNIAALVTRAPLLSEISQRRSSDFISREELSELLIQLIPAIQSPGVDEDTYDAIFEEAIQSRVDRLNHSEARKAIGDDINENIKKLPERAGRGTGEIKKRKGGRKGKNEHSEIVPLTGIDSI